MSFSVVMIHSPDAARSLTATGERCKLLLAQARAFVEGWATDLNELLAEALRRYLESHSSQLSEAFIREDVEWGSN